jgi:glycosyltransferase involved in cell wall biosynthesis
MGKPLLRNAALLIATSKQEEQELLEDGFPRDRVVIRYNGVDLKEFLTLPPKGTFRSEWALPQDEPIVLFLGRLIPRKGVDLLIDAFSAACPKSGRLVIAGPEGEIGYVARMREIAREKKVEDRTIFTGPLYGDQRKAVLADSQIFALPSRYENFANSVAEAIACGIPCIVTTKCGVSEFVRDRVGLVIPRETGPLTDALRQLLGDAALYDGFRQECPKVASELSWQELLGKQQDMYSRVLQNKKEPH